MRRPPLIVAASAALAFVAISAALRLQAGSAPAAGAGHRPLPVGVALSRRPPPVQLRDERGHADSLAALRGRWVALAPSMTLCQEVCPITTGALLRVRRLMAAAGAARRFTVVELTTDPWRDSPRRLRAFRRLTGADVVMLTGSVRNVRRLWRFFGVGFRRLAPRRPPAIDWMTGRPERFDVEHSDGVFLLDPAGRERVAIAGMPSLGGRLAAPLRALLDGEGRRNLARPRAPWRPAEVAADLRRLMGLRAPDVAPPSLTAARRRLRGSPTALATLHENASRLLPGDGLEPRLASLRGFPVVVNAWASWCPPCRGELPLFAAASASFGRHVAFLGADVDDDASAARQMLAEQPLSYPSYEASSGQIASLLAPLQGTPVTFFLAPDGTVADEHVGAYSSRAALDADLRALLGSG